MIINCKIRGEWQRQCCRYRIAETHNLLLALDFYSCIALNDCIAIKHGKCYERSACRMVFIFRKCRFILVNQILSWYPQ